MPVRIRPAIYTDLLEPTSVFVSLQGRNYHSSIGPGSGDIFLHQCGRNCTDFARTSSHRVFHFHRAINPCLLRNEPVYGIPFQDYSSTTF